MFDDISDFMITPPHLCHKHITITVLDRTIIGYPMCLEASKYDRNAYFFSLGIILAGGPSGVDPRPFYPFLAKLATAIETLELESEYLFKDKTRLEPVLQEVFVQLKAYGDCSVIVDASNRLCLKLFPSLPLPPEPGPHEVPVRLVDLDAVCNADWDLTLRPLLPLIDGVNYVKRIAGDSDVDVALVQKCLRQLLYYGCIAMIDIFQCSNVYVPTARLAQLVAPPRRPLLSSSSVLVGPSGTTAPASSSSSSPSAVASSAGPSSPEGEKEPQAQMHPGWAALTPLQRSCILYVATPPPLPRPSGATTAAATPTHTARAAPASSPLPDARLSSPPPFPVSAVFRLYASLGSTDNAGSAPTPIGQLAERAQALGVDLRRLAAFGVLNGLIRRVHKYPVRLPLPASSSAASSPSADAVLLSPSTTAVAGPSPPSAAVASPSLGELSSREVAQLEGLLDGRHCLDEICCALDRSAAEVEAILREDPRVTVIHR